MAKPKRCAPVAGSYTTAERESAIDSLVEFSRREEFQSFRSGAERAYFANDEGLSRWLGTPQEELVVEGYLAYLLYDRTERCGRTVVENHLEQVGKLLTAAERRFLTDIGQSCWRPYEVLEVYAGEAMRLRDLWTPGEHWVSDRVVTRNVVPFDVLAARLLPWPDGRFRLDGGLYLYLPSVKRRLLRALDELQARALRNRFPASATAILKCAGPLYHCLWEESYEGREGEPEELLLESQADVEYWLDRAHSSLDDRSPRQAARLPEYRGRLTECVKQIENSLHRISFSRDPKVDVRKLWSELDLQHPAGDGELVRAPRDTSYPRQFVHLPHYRVSAGFEMPAPARRLARYYETIAAACLSVPVARTQRIHVRCRRRPGHKPCPGFLAVRVEGDAEAAINWRCPVCGDGGRITGWREQVPDRERELGC